MSFTRLPYDTCTYQHDLGQSVGPGHYQYDAPRAECHACFAPDPQIRAQLRGVSTCENYGDFIDASSELRGITRRASSCPADKYIPNSKPFCKMQTLPDCPQLTKEDTRLSNPPCTLRGTGWNRWEWLCRNPQDKAIMPFEWNVSNRIVVKDNHRPCVPVPLDQTQGLPAPTLQSRSETGLNAYKATASKEFTSPMQDIQIPSTHWRKCQAYANYMQQQSAY